MSCIVIVLLYHLRGKTHIRKHVFGAPAATQKGVDKPGQRSRMCLIDTLHACGPIHPPCTSVYTAATAESYVTACHTFSLLQGKAVNTQPNLFLSQKHVSEKDVMTQRQVSLRSGRADIYRVKTARLLKAM